VQAIFRHTLGSVIFGIGLMALVGGYIAIGSGCPSVRAYFEMTDLEFFNAWPLKVLMGLLVANLAVVTWTRIPLTPPRYGVWCIHSGIITLVLGTSLYYHNKMEGQTRIGLKQTVGWFYDNTERALYVSSIGLDSMQVAVHPLDSLPRFNSYNDDLGNGSKLDRSDLRDIEVFQSMDPQTGRPRFPRLADMLLTPQPVRLDVTGFWPYATVSTDFIPDPRDGQTVIELRMGDPHGTSGDSEHTFWLSAAQDRTRNTIWDETELEHRIALDSDELDHLKAAYRDIPAKVHHLSITTGDSAAPLEMYVEPGKSYPVGATGYTIDVEGYYPSWPMFETHEQVTALSLKVTPPASSLVPAFRRMLLNGKDLQTDFDLTDASAGPMGKRQTQPLDKKLVILYRFDDPMGLLPTAGSVKHTFVTEGKDVLVDLVTSLKRESEDQGSMLPRLVTSMDASAGVKDLGGGGSIDLTMGEQKMSISVARRDGMAPIDRVTETPLAHRTQAGGESGDYQVVTVKISTGTWSREVAVPYTQWPLDTVAEWDGPLVSIPGTAVRLKLELGNMCCRLPADITLDQFELVRYPGSDPREMNGPMRDFRSTLTIQDRATGQSTTDVAHMNSPIYFDDGRWLFFQSAWDPDQQKFSIIGVGTRPAVNVMLCGCVMIFAGLMYAFWIKPVIIANMKAAALARAAGEKTRREPDRLVVP
jgi:hypothetical protein